MVWCGGGCVTWSFGARLCVGTFGVECGVTHHGMARLWHILTHIIEQWVFLCRGHDTA